MGKCLAAVVLSLTGIGIPWTSWARPLQIIHTNDLHSHLEHSDLDGIGGYAAVKAAIDRIKARASAQGIETLVLDAGDFSEGTQLFLAKEGRDSWKIMDSMGYDAVAIGNHDWLVGPWQMDWIVGQVQPQVPFVSANFKAPRKFQNLRRYIHPYELFTRAGLRIAVLGLSTDDMLYSWRAAPAKLLSPADVAGDLVPELRDGQKADAVVALTHLGVDDDRSLIDQTDGIDLVVGGHSHTALTSPVYEENPSGTRIPIVQAGQHGEYVGDLLVDVEPGRPVEVLRYGLVPVSLSGAHDPAIEGEVRQARADLEAKFGGNWLHETLVDSLVPMERPFYHSTEWGDLFAQAILESAPGADFAFDVGEFYGSTLPPGPVNRERLIQFYPRVFDVTTAKGWTVWKVSAPGWLMEIIFQSAVESGRFFNTAGITYDVRSKGGKLRVKNLRVNGRPMHWYDEYEIAVTEGVGRGSQDLSFWTDLFLSPRDTGIPVLEAVERKIRALPGPIVP